MSVQDRDLERALGLLGEEVSLAPAEVDSAYRAFLDKAVRARRRRWQRLVAASAAAVLLVGGAAAYWASAGRGKDRLLPVRPTATQSSVISAQELVGVWAMHADWASPDGGLWTFLPDGTGGYSNNANTLEVPFQYSLKGAALGAHDSTGCGFSYHLTGYRSGTLTADVHDHCNNNGPGISWVRLSPATPAGKAVPMPPMTGATPVSRLSQVGGVWLMPGTGLLLAIQVHDSTHATYVLDDHGRLTGSALDAGAVTLQPNGTLVLSSTKPAPSGCAAHQPARIVLRGAVALAGKGVQAGNGVTSTCPRADVQASWIMVSSR